MAKFRLETVLKVRVMERDQRRAELAEAYQALTVLEERRADLVRELEASQAEAVQGVQPGAVDVDRLLRGSRHTLMLRGQVQLIEQQQTQVEQEIERRRLVLVDADRQVRILEKLREREVLAEQQRLRKQEQKQLDEVALRRFPPSR